jgi:hypothetical protein
MGTSLDREFRLAPPGGRGISCDANGAFLGSIPLLKRSEAGSEWEPCECAELSEQISAEFGLTIDMSSKMGGLNAISRALNENDIARAQIATLLLGIPDHPSTLNESPSQRDLIKFVRDLYWTGLIKIDDESDLQKAGYNPGEPRDECGRWTCEGADAAHLDDGVYHPDNDPAHLDPIGDPKQLLLNQLTHQQQVNQEVAEWRKKGFTVTTNVWFRSATTGTPIVADYVVSIWVPDPAALFLWPTLEPILARDVKTGGGGLTDNQKEVYPHILAGGKVIPVGLKAAQAGFWIGFPTTIQELYVGHDLPSDTVH